MFDPFQEDAPSACPAPWIKIAREEGKFAYSLLRDRALPNIDQRYRTISMFSGCGGMDLGFQGGFEIFGRRYASLPFEILWSNDLNKAACQTYARNLGHQSSCGDIWEALDSMPQSADVIIGGFPCQDISVNGKRQGVGGSRSGLYRAMVEAISRIRPLIFVAENVKGLLLKYSAMSLRAVIRDFESLGYNLHYQLYRIADYGIPQNRERVFIVGVLRGAGSFTPPPPLRTSWMTAREAIGDLEGVAEDPNSNHIWSRANVSPEQGNRRLDADRPAHTIRAECHGNIQFHYNLPRRISMREAARIQSFPDNFIFTGGLRETERQLGNAVPPVMAWHIATAVCACLDKAALRMAI